MLGAVVRAVMGIGAVHVQGTVIAEQRIAGEKAGACVFFAADHPNIGNSAIVAELRCGFAAKFAQIRLSETGRVSAGTRFD